MDQPVPTLRKSSESWERFSVILTVSAIVSVLCIHTRVIIDSASEDFPVR